MDIFGIQGIRLATCAAGIKKKGTDMVVIECAPGTHAAAVFTQNKACAAPVIVAREHLLRAMPRVLVINSGNANAGTGDVGLQAARETCAAAAKIFDCDATEVLPFSTGVIGKALPADKLVQQMPACKKQLAQDGWQDAALGIMTTDTRPKLFSQQIDIAGKKVALTGMAKGVGMVCPNMATVLVYIGTDANIASTCLDEMTRVAVNRTLNRITVDGDTSTNDACVVLATGKAGNATIENAASPEGETFAAALTELMQQLSEALIRDAEGASKFITIDVQKGPTEEDCLAVAYTVAHSPLVKTALFASDANWGRILAAIGRAPVQDLDVNKINIHINDVLTVARGAMAPGYTEEQGAAAMKPQDIAIRIELGTGSANAQVLTSDLSYDYVRINAEYRT